MKNLNIILKAKIFIVLYLAIMAFVQISCEPKPQVGPHVDDQNETPVDQLSNFTISDFQLTGRTSYSLQFSGVLTGDRLGLKRSGIAYSTSTNNPLVLTSFVYEVVEYGENGQFTIELDNLEQATKYYVRFFIEKDSGDIVYSENTIEVTTVGWYRMVDFPGQIRSGSGYVTIGGSGYVFNGVASNGFTAVNDIWKFDNNEREWSKIDSKGFPLKSGNEYKGARNFVIKTPYNGKAYVGLYNKIQVDLNESYFVRDFYEYDPSNNTWAELPPFPEESCWHCVSYSLGGGGKEIFVEGYRGSNTQSSLKFIYRYDVNSKSWSLFTLRYGFQFQITEDPINIHATTLDNVPHYYVQSRGSDSHILYNSFFDAVGALWNIKSYNNVAKISPIISFEFSSLYVFIDKNGTSVAYDFWGNKEWFRIVDYPVPNFGGFYPGFIFKFEDSVMMGLGTRGTQTTPMIYRLDK